MLVRKILRYVRLSRQHTFLALFSNKFSLLILYSHTHSPSSGQIEVFTWSASGAIITETLASCLPTVIAYVVDTPRCISPVTFMSNMLYACSILYKSRLPFVLVFNKTDIVSHDFATQWMTDSEAFQVVRVWLIGRICKNLRLCISSIKL